MQEHQLHHQVQRNGDPSDCPVEPGRSDSSQAVRWETDSNSFGASCVVPVTLMPRGSSRLPWCEVQCAYYAADLRAGKALERVPAGIARGSDGLLDFVVLAAAWTIVYHVCLLLRLGTAWATVAGGLALLACGWFVARRTSPPLTDEPVEPAAEAGRSGRLRAAVAVQVAAGLGAAALYAFTDTRWSAISLLWLLAAGAASSPPICGRPRVALVESRSRPASERRLRCSGQRRSRSLLLTVRSAEDDTYYVRLSAWIAEHGVFPLRDTLFSDQVYPAIFYPPISSYEAAVGTVARVTGLAVRTSFYYVVAPVTSVFGVLALWRLYRAWRRWSPSPLGGDGLPPLRRLDTPRAR